MKKITFKLTLLLSLSLLIFSGCQKDNADPKVDDPGTTAPVNKGSFSWTPAGGSAITADSAHYYTSFTTIFAFKNGNATTFEINLSSLAVGAYTLSTATGNALTFVTASTTYTAHTGNVLITTNNGSKMSGTFNATLNGGSITGVSGQFTDILKKN